MNEPKDAATTEVVNPIFAETIEQIRRTTPSGRSSSGQAGGTASASCPTLRLPDDDENLIVTVHNYDPFYFTHQGATWSGPDTKLTGILFPGPPLSRWFPIPSSSSVRRSSTGSRHTTPSPQRPTRAARCAFQAAIDQAREWSEYYGRPVHVGEFGCFTTADPASRAHYYRAFREAAEQPGSAGPSGTGRPASATGTRRPAARSPACTRPSSAQVQSVALRRVKTTAGELFSTRQTYFAACDTYFRVTESCESHH